MAIGSTKFVDVPKSDMSHGTFDGIVTDFYRAATGAISWAQALTGVQVAFGATGANLHTVDVRRGQILSMHTGGKLINEANFNYVKEFHLVDPVRSSSVAQGAFFQPGRWVHCHELFDDAFVNTSPFYQDFSLAYQVRYNSSVTVSVEDGAVVTAFSLLLPSTRGVLSPDERELARRLGEHLGEALIANERVRRLAAQALAGHGLLNSFPHPMCLIDKDRFISFENPAATAELATEKRFVRIGGRLALTHSRSNQQFTERLQELYQRGHGASTVVDLRAIESDTPTWLHLSLLEPAAVMGTFGGQPLALATLFDPQQVGTLDPFALSNMFKLSPTESRVAVRLAEGMTPDQISLANGTAITTVRSQISKVIEKLGAKRSTDVVRLLRQGEALWSTAGRTNI